MKHCFINLAAILVLPTLSLPIFAQVTEDVPTYERVAIEAEANAVEANKVALEARKKATEAAIAVSNTEAEESSESNKADIDKKQDAEIAKLKSLANDGDRLDGDILKLTTNVSPFKLLRGNASDVFCAPKNSRVRVTKEEDGVVFLNFKSVPSGGVLESFRLSKENEDDSVNDCAQVGELPTVFKDEQYSISRAILDDFGYERRGLSFGALVVPFKYYLGGDKRISASTTVAPYIGYRRFRVLGLNIMPVVSAGLGLVPVNVTITNTDFK